MHNLYYSNEWLIPALPEDNKSPIPTNAITRAPRLMPFSGIYFLYIAYLRRRRASNSDNSVIELCTILVVTITCYTS